MFSFRTTALLEQPDGVLKGGKIALLCDQTAFHPDRGEYLYETLAKRGVLKRLFWLGEPIPNLNFDFEIIYLSYYKEIDWSLMLSQLLDIEALVIELQESGVRYDGAGKLLYSLFQSFKENSIDLPLYLVDRLNPSGRQIEGSAAKGEEGSLHQMEGVLHKHGLTAGELAHYFYNELGGKFNLHIISSEAEAVNKQLLPWSIPPHNNFSGLFTPSFYSGQALWRESNISCGVGTTRPYELFGAPFLKELLEQRGKESAFEGFNQPNHPLHHSSIIVRPLSFTPLYNIYKDELCWGFQLHLLPGLLYHALAHNLRIIKFIKGSIEHFGYTTELHHLLGDPLLSEWIEGEVEFEELREHIKIEEQKWIRKVRKILLYKAPPFRCKTIL
ncbi:MAG: exo-beta-N-acetylmuramidase NamZ domain-containing protein [Bacteroidales bacterium]